MSRPGRTPEPDSRLPPWAWIAILAGAVAAYLGTGQFLLGVRFWPDLASLAQDPIAFFRGPAESVAPFVLLLVPGVLGGVWTRDTLRVAFTGMRRGDAPLVIAKDVALFALSFAVLILVGLTSSATRSH